MGEFQTLAVGGFGNRVAAAYPLIVPGAPTRTYVVDTTSEPGCISRAATYSWPTLSPERRMPIVITYVVGWTDPALIPELIKQGLRYHIAASDADRTGAGDGDAGRRAAAAVWAMAGPVYWREPETCRA